MRTNFATLLVPLVLLVSISGLTNAADHGHEWSYDKHNGPNKWPGVCSTGRFQSPIDLSISAAHPRYFEPLVFFQYDVPANVTIKNNGHTLTMMLHQPCTAQVGGGGLPGAYALAQVHFHWESEHTVDGKRFPLEAHFVHYNRKRFTNVASAVGKDDGLAVIGVLFQESAEPNPTLERILDHVNKVVQAGSEASLSTELLLEALLPQKEIENFYRYRGSLTTPGCNEGVLWTVLRAYATISQQQVAQFKLLQSRSGRLDINFRPVQPLNERNLYYRVGSGAPAGTAATVSLLAVTVTLLLAKML